MSGKRRAGLIQLTSNGQRFDAKGNFTYNIGKPKREGIPGADRVHGYKETVQVPFIEGEITDSGGLSLEALTTLEDQSIVLQLAMGPQGPAKAIVLHDGWYAGEGTGNTEEGNIGVRFEAETADEVAP